jgi:protein farnesyltransferase subunit beta
MHHDGEVDVRATYCVMTVLALLGLLALQQQPSLSTSVSSSSSSLSSSGELSINYQSAIDYVVRCQTYEGGIGGEPWTEAHGGYTFCGVAALQIMGYFHTQKRSQHASFSSSPQLDIQSLVGWLSRRQLSYEGGFSGRSNKLVDGCYSFWQGGAIAIASAAVAEGGGGGGGSGGISNDGTPHDPWLESYRRQGSDRCMTDSLDLPFPLLFDVAMLERYILLCAQEIEGGLRDKPSKPRDFYHSCYNLSGLSVAQKCSRVRKSDDEDELSDEWFGDQIQTSLAVTHPVYNIRIERVDAILTKTWD